jgi:hypothetical protein
VIEPMVALVLGKIQEDSQLWLPFYAVGQVLRFEPDPAGPASAVGALVFLAAMLAVLAAGVAGFIRRDA